MRLAAEDHTNDDLQAVDETVRAGRNVAGPYAAVHGICWGLYRLGRKVEDCDCVQVLLDIDEDTRQRRRADV